MGSQWIRQRQIPDTPGVYFFNSKGGVLYIGRATSLKSRVLSYFRDDVLHTRGPRIVDMVTRADDIKWKETNSVLEAIILEAELIKKHQPPANTEGKDGKSFNCVVITDEAFPQVLVVRKKDIDFGKLTAYSLQLKASYGPFPQSGLLKDALKIIRRLFPYRDEKCHPLQGKPCFNRQLGLCPGVCTGEISSLDYKKIISRLILFFEGKTQALERGLKREMMTYAKALNFEKAGEVKRVLFGLRHIQEVALLGREVELDSERARPQAFRIEAYDVAHLGGKNMVGVMVAVENGVIKKTDYRTFNIRGFSEAHDVGALREVITRRLKHGEWPTPSLVVVDGNEVQRKVAVKLFKKVSVVAVVKNERHRPERLLGDKQLIKKYKRQILLANSESHRFSIARHRRKATRAFLG